MRFGIGWLVNEDFDEAVRCVREVERLGFEYVWVWEDPVAKNDFIVSSLFALNTSHVRIGLSAVSPYYRNPVIIASSVLTLDSLSNGRVVLSVAVGDWRVLWRVGVKPKNPVLRLRETIESLKRMFVEEKVRYDGKLVSFGSVKFGWVERKRRIPVFASVNGPSMLRMAGEVADGVILPHTPPEYLAYAMEVLRDSVKKAGKSFKDFEVAVHLEVFVDEDYDVALNSAKKSYAQLGFFTHLPIVWEKAGFSREEVKLIQKDVLNIPENLIEKIVEKFAVVGTPEDCIRKLRVYERLGVTHLQLTPVTGKVEKDFYALMWHGKFKMLKHIKYFGEKVFQAFRL